MAATKNTNKTASAKKQTGKPKITVTERDWHEHTAGVAASKKAGEGDSELGVHVLDQSTQTQYETVCGWELRPATNGTSIELAHLGKWADGLPTLEDELDSQEREMLFLTLMAMAYANAVKFRQIRQDGGFDALIAEANRLNFSEPAEELKKMFIHVGTNVALINQLTDSQQSIVKSDAPNPDSGK